MQSFFTLFKVSLKERFRILPEANGRKNRKWLIFLVLGISFLPLLALVFIAMLSMGTLAVQLELVTEMLTALIIMLQLMVLFTGVPSVLSNVYFSRDAERMLTLPVPPQTVFTVKLLVVYVYELITAFIIGLVALLPFGIGASVSPLYYTQMLLVILISPMVPLFAAALLSIPLMWVISFFKNKGALTTIMQLLLFTLIFGGYYFIIYKFSINSSETDFEAILAAIVTAFSGAAKVFPPDYWLAKTLNASSFWDYLANMGLSLASNAVILAAAVGVSALVYGKSVSKQLENPKSNKVAAVKEYRTQGVLRSLIGADIKNILRTPQIGMSCLLQLVMAPILIVFMGLNFSGIEGMGDILSGGIAAFSVAGMLCFFGFSLNYVGMAAITRDGKSFYLSKIIPVDFKTQARAKVILAQIFNVVSLVIALGSALLVVNVAWYDALFILVIVGLFSQGTVYIQVMVDLSKPRLNWNTFMEGAKNNPASLWSMLVGMIIMLVVIAAAVVAVLFGGWLYFAMWWLLAVIGGVYVAVMRIIFFKRVPQLYESIVI